MTKPSLSQQRLPTIESLSLSFAVSTVSSHDKQHAHFHCFTVQNCYCAISVVHFMQDVSFNTVLLAVVPPVGGPVHVTMYDVCSQLVFQENSAVHDLERAANRQPGYRAGGL